MVNYKTPIYPNPDLLDKVIGDIQIGLAAHLKWLDRAYGRAERISKKSNSSRKRLTLPCVYAGGNEYKELSPDEWEGNSCFFTVDDPQTIEQVPGMFNSINTRFSIIFWFDYRKIFKSGNVRNKEEVKAQILDLLNGKILVENGTFRIDRVYELAENIYKGFSIDEIDNQFLMHPFGGFRFEGDLYVRQNCRL